MSTPVVTATPGPCATRPSTVSPNISVDQQQLKAFEENKKALSELQEQMSIYRKERAENEKLVVGYLLSILELPRHYLM